MYKKIILGLLLIAVSSSVFAQRFNRKVETEGFRASEWEVSVSGVGQGSSDLSSEGGSSLEVDSGFGWGFTFGYNLTAKWNFEYRFAMLKPDYVATIVPEDPDELPARIGYSMNRYSNQLNATYNFMKGRFTPYVKAGVGWTKLDSNVPEAPPQTGCWWDPWWGWICNTTWSTYDTTEFTYNAGVGFRWDINGALFMRGSYSREWIKLDSGSMDFDLMSVDMGLMW